MKLSFAPYTLQFRHPFGLSHSTRSTTDVVYVKIEKYDQAGYGEAALPPYLPENQQTVTDLLKRASPLLNEDLASLQGLLKKIDVLAPGNTAAKAAIDIALHDLFGRIQKKAVYDVLGLKKPEPKETSVTIAIGDLALIPQKLMELEDFKLIKVKLGNPNDKEIIDEIRKLTKKPLAVDVNQGWPDKEFALDMIHWLATRNVLYVEQPLTKDNFKDMRWLKEKSPLPVLADESFQRLSDLDKVSEAFSGINIKLMKCAGLLEATKIVAAAKEKGLKINIGCMSESSCGIAAAAQLMHYADWIDLDGPMLIRNDPFGGVSFKDGKLHLSDAPGTGTVLLKELSFQDLR